MQDDANDCRFLEDLINTWADMVRAYIAILPRDKERDAKRSKQLEEVQRILKEQHQPPLNVNLHMPDSPRDPTPDLVTGDGLYCLAVFNEKMGVAIDRLGHVWLNEVKRGLPRGVYLDLADTGVLFKLATFEGGGFKPFYGG